MTFWETLLSKFKHKHAWEVVDEAIPAWDVGGTKVCTTCGRWAVHLTWGMVLHRTLKHHSSAIVKNISNNNNPVLTALKSRAKLRLLDGGCEIVPFKPSPVLDAAEYKWRKG